MYNSTLTHLPFLNKNILNIPDSLTDFLGKARTVFVSRLACRCIAF